MERHHQRKLQKVRTSIGTSWSGLHQQHATTTTTTTTDQIKISTGAVGVTNQGNLCKGTPFNLTQVALIATPVTPVAHVLVLVWSVVVVVVVVACCWCSPLQLAPMLVLIFSNLRWWCFSYINWRKYSTCTCGDDHLLQLALVVFYLPATGANTPFARVQLALCGGACVVVLEYMW